MPIPVEVKAKIFKADGTSVTWCMFCGAKVGQESQRTGETAAAMFWCERCKKNYCDQCSCSREADGKRVQYCLRCDSRLENLTVLE